MSLEPHTLIGTVLDGKYAIESYVAKGGFGIVYRGTHLRLRKPLAIKVLHLRDDLPAGTARSVREQFEEEARLVAGLDHAAIVRVLDSGGVTLPSGLEVPWMVTEWVDGTTLANDLKDRRGRGGRTPAECMRLLKPVFEALIYAHSTGVVHRDIKPANLMFTAARRESSAPGGVPLKLLDFGIAKVVEPEEGPASGETATQSTHISFSMKYGAPEQFSGARTGPWTDVHAMALILTEMLTDRAPYEGRTAMDVHLEAMSPARPTPSRFDVNVGGWEPVLARALALRPPDRFASVEAFLAALEAAVPPADRASVGVPLPVQRNPMNETDAGIVNTGTLPPMTARSAVEVSSPKRWRVQAMLATVGALALFVGVAFAKLRGGERATEPSPAARSPVTTAPTHEAVIDAAVPLTAPGSSQRVASPESVLPRDAGQAIATRHRGRRSNAPTRRSRIHAQ